MSRHGKFADDTARISVVLSAADKETLSKLAREDERTLSAWCKRQLVRIATGKRARFEPQAASGLTILREMQAYANGALATRKD